MNIKEKAAVYFDDFHSDSADVNIYSSINRDGFTDDFFSGSGMDFRFHEKKASSRKNLSTHKDNYNPNFNEFFYSGKLFKQKDYKNRDVYTFPDFELSSKIAGSSLNLFSLLERL